MTECSPATNQPLLHGKAMAQRMHIDVPPVTSLFRNMGALANETTRMPAAEAAAALLPASTTLQAPYPQVDTSFLAMQTPCDSGLGMPRCLSLTVWHGGGDLHVLHLAHHAS